MAKLYNVGILGATGAVGREMLKVLQERNFPVNELRLLASARSVGKKLAFNGKEVEVVEAKIGAFKGLDIVLGAASNPIAMQFKDDIVSSGAVFIDNSSAFRLENDVPLVIPEINGDDVFNNKGIIANPNCSTIIALVAAAAINRLSKIKAMYVSTYQATSGAGVNGPIELFEQMADLTDEYKKSGEPVIKGKFDCKVFPHQIAGNVIPFMTNFVDDGYTKEEMKMQNEGRKIMHLPKLRVNCTCVRVPVVRSHTISATVITEEKLSLDAVRESIKNTAGCVLYDDKEKGEYPMPILTSDQDLVYVGRIRPDLVNDNGISFISAGDQVRKGAATNAVQIAQKLIERL